MSSQGSKALSYKLKIKKMKIVIAQKTSHTARQRDTAAVATGLTISFNKR